MTERLGRADLHIHTLASDGTAGIVEILDHVERNTELDVIAITDHERIDAALAGRAMARDRGLSFEVVVGEEVTTLGGHLLALWIESPVKPFRSLRSTIAAIHDQGGLAIPAHPLVPYPLCAQGFVLRRLLADEPRYRPDAIEAFNPTTLGRPWHGRVVRFAEEHHLARVGNSDAHSLNAIGAGYTTFHGHDGAALRAAIRTATTHHHGSFHATGAQLGTFGAQLRKYGRDARANLGGRIRRDGTSRDLGYPAEYEAIGGAAEVPPMNRTGLPLLVIVSGAPGAGKTTLARTISSRLELPFLARDELKETIGDELGTPNDVPASQLLGLAAYRILFAVAARILESGGGAVIESNFRRGVSEPDLRPIIEMADARLIHCSADTQTVQARYAERHQRGDRHPVHLDAHRAGGLADDLASGRFEPLTLDIPTLVVATDDGYDPALDELLEFLTTQGPVTEARTVAAAR